MRCNIDKVAADKKEHDRRGEAHLEAHKKVGTSLKLHGFERSAGMPDRKDIYI